MIRVIKRYESRKLYDTEESRYVSLEDIAGWVRDGQEVQVIDNATSENVTNQVLTQVILDEDRRGASFLPTDLLHELVRTGEKAIHNGVEQVQQQVDRFVQRSIDRLAPVRRAREEMTTLRQRLAELETTLVKLEQGTTSTKPSARKTKAKVKKSAAKAKTTAGKAKTTARKSAKRKPTTKKTTAKKTTAAKTTAKKTAVKKTGTRKTGAARKTAARKTTTRKTAAADSAAS